MWCMTSVSLQYSLCNKCSDELCSYRNSHFCLQALWHRTELGQTHISQHLAAYINHLVSTVMSSKLQNNNVVLVFIIVENAIRKFIPSEQEFSSLALTLVPPLLFLLLCVSD